MVEAIFSEALDASFIGPNPAINAYAKSNGEAIRIVSGTTSGGASLVVREGIDVAGGPGRATIATPSLGNTQDVALRAWLLEQGYETDTSGGGDVSITPQDNADTLAAFQSGALDGAWVPEPWATRLVLEGGGQGPRRRGGSLARRSVRHDPSDRRTDVPRRAPRRDPRPDRRSRRSHRRSPTPIRRQRRRR